MVSPELIRRYPFFAGLSHDHVDTLAQLAEEVTVEPDHVFFREDESLDRFYLLVEGAVAVFLAVPDPARRQPVSGQLTGRLETADVIVSTVGPGEVFGWSGLVPPPVASAGAKAVARSRVLAFDTGRLSDIFDADCQLAYRITQKAASVLRERLRDMRIESLSQQQE